MKKNLLLLIVLVIFPVQIYAQAKLEKAECDTTNYNLTMVLSCPQSKEILYRAAKEWLATHVQNFQHKLQYDDKETGTIKFRNSSYLHTTKPYRQKATIDMTGTIDYMVTITIKDGKYRLKTEDAMANWQEYFIFNGQKQNNGRKSLELKALLLWTEDANLLNSYSSDNGKIADGIWLRAKELETDDF